MANTDRRYIDGDGNTLIPMNVEGGQWQENFMTTPKTITIVVIVLVSFLLITYCKSNNSNILGYIIYLGGWLFLSSFAIRFIVFEEKFYFKMYKLLQEKEISTPSIFWDIAAIDDTIGGAIMTYSDAKIGVIIKLERDTIVGKQADFKEVHIDAISDFYRELNRRGYSYIHMNTMETAGTDARLAELDKLTYKDKLNPNINKLMQLQVGYIKSITRRTLYETDYVLIYTKQLQKLDTIIDDVDDIALVIMDGGFASYKILNKRDLVEMQKEEHNVSYFDSTEATLQMFNTNGVEAKAPVKIKSIVFMDGEEAILDDKGIKRVQKLTSEVEKRTVDINKISIRKAFLSRENKNEKAVEFTKLDSTIPDRVEERKVEQRKKRLEAVSELSEGISVDSLGPEEDNIFDNTESEDDYIDI